MAAKLLHSRVTYTCCKQCVISWAFRVLLHRSAHNWGPSSSATVLRDSLFTRISPVGNPRVSIVPILDQWAEEGKRIDGPDLQNIVKRLRKFRRFNHALELSEWMSKDYRFEVLPGYVAIRLDLISKVHGIQQAEEYFNNIPDNLRNFQVHGALLNCYAHVKSVKKAEASMQRMRELGYWGKLSYNVMLNLYSQIGNHEKVDILAQEMQEKGISFDKFTYSIMLTSYAAASNITALENLLMKVEADPMIIVDWELYSVATNCFIDVGQKDKALAAARKFELLVGFKSSKKAYNYLLSLYARMGHKDEVYRVWGLLKKRVRLIYNTTYLSMMGSLGKLDDIDGMEKIFEDWEAINRSFDFRIPNLLITTYGRLGLLEKAESLVERLRVSGKLPQAGTWQRLAAGYHRHGDLEKAVDAMKKAIEVGGPGYRPNLAIVMGCLDYLGGLGDDKEAEFRTLLEERGHSIGDDLEDDEKLQVRGLE